MYNYLFKFKNTYLREEIYKQVYLRTVLMNRVSFCCFLLFLFFVGNHYVPINQANWCNMTFADDNLFPCHGCYLSQALTKIGLTK